MPEIGADQTVRSLRAVGQGTARASGRFDPSLRQPIEWQDVPEAGLPLSLSSAGEPMPVIQLLDQIAESTNWNVVSTPSLDDKRIRIWAFEVTPRDLLEIMRFHGIYYAFDEDIRLLRVMTVEEHVEAKFGSIERTEFSIQYAEVNDIQTVLDALTSENGMMIVDPRTGNVIVWDTPDNLREMEDTLDRLDNPLAQESFQLKHVAAENVLDSVQNVLSEIGVVHADPRSNMLIVTDLPSRHAQIHELMEVLDKPVETRTWTLNYLEPDLVLDRLGDLVPFEMGPASVDDRTHQISISATPERLDEIDDLIRRWDVQPKQVQIEAFLVSTSKGVARDLGVAWNYFDAASGTSFGLQSGRAVPSYDPLSDSGQRLTIGRLPYRVPLFDFWTGDPVRDASGSVVLDPQFRGSRISAVINYLEEEKQLRVLSRPRVTVLDGEEAVFKNTRELPYQTGGYTDTVAGTPGTIQPGFSRVIPMRTQFITVGTILTVLPRINEEGNIIMDIMAEDSDAEPDIVIVGDQQSSVPSKSESSAESRIMVHDGQTLVIGGLRAGRFQDDEEKVPVLGDVPLLGRLFRSTNKSTQDREIMIFITPTIVDEFTRPEALRLTEEESRLRDDIRHEAKRFPQRFQAWATGRQNELSVSIGQTGAMFSEGSMVTIEELRNVLYEVPRPESLTLVVRQHPDAPPMMTTEVLEIAMELGIEVELETESAPFVPPERSLH